MDSEIEAKTALTKSIASRDLAALTSAIAKAQALNLDLSELQQAIALKTRVEQENECIKHVEDAVKSKNTVELSTWMSKSVELGLDIKVKR